MTLPTILFGAFDRHNLGDLLFPHVATALLPNRPLIYAGLAERDMREWGGHPVHALVQLASQWGDKAVRLIHAGGELLTCNAWEAAVMLQPPAAAQLIIDRLDANPVAREAWSEGILGVASRAPYCVPPKLFPAAQRRVYCGVGGVGLAESPSAQRHEVLDSLRAANAVAVRDRLTLAHVRAAGIPARLIPDPASMVAELFASTIDAHTERGELADIQAAFPQGYLAVQIGADFCDDATLADLADQLDRAASAARLGIVLFRAGAAPWHDDLECLQRLARRLRTRPLTILNSIYLWDICALIAGSRGYCGSSLHGRIVAMAFGLPRVNLLHPAQAGHPTKQAAYAATWELPGQPGAVHLSDLAGSLARSLTSDANARRRHAHELANLYREGFTALNP